ncbi:MAG: CPXCG motif-containing cysteine-rich protein [Candidatus Omnitrophica bacterium]|nr:CPXCG motif-containing cysteine-rich protein [Candidatus Omnitrophota bacterium]
MLSNDSNSFPCPYCGSDNYLDVDPGGGRRQRLIVDCEICCQPIAVQVSVSPEGDLEINARPENE